MPATKRFHGQGCVERRGRRWRFRLRLADGTRRSSPTYDTREECQAVLDAALYEVARGNMAPVGAITLGPFGARFLADRQTRSAGNDRGLWQRHVMASDLAAVPIADIRPRHLRDLVAALSQKRKVTAKSGGSRGERIDTEQRLSGQTVKLIYALVRRVLSEAVTEEIIENNPARSFRLPREVKSSKDRWTYLTPEEIDKLVACPSLPEPRRLRFQFAIYTGLREGELWGLRWEDIELDGPLPRCAVRRSYDGTTKSGAVRKFPLLPGAVTALRRLRDLAGNPAPSSLVFPSPTGGMYCKGYDAGWARARRLAGIIRPVRFHDLRHTCASHLLMGSWGKVWSLADVRDYLGHSSITVTERYAHLAPGRLSALARDTGHTNAPAAIDAVEVHRPAYKMGPKRDQTGAHLRRPVRAALVGDRGAIRTRDLLFRKQLLYPTELRSRGLFAPPAVRPVDGPLSQAERVRAHPLYHGPRSTRSTFLLARAKRELKLRPASTQPG